MQNMEKYYKTQMNLEMQKIYEEYSDRVYNKISCNRKDSGLIFHYTSAEGFYNIITNKKLFFTDVAFLNDSTETVNIITTFLKALKEIEGVIEEEYLEKLKKLMELGDFEDMVFGSEEGVDLNRYFILACSYQKDSLNMWNYYTKGKDSDWGYNIAFDEEELVDSIFQLNHKNYGEKMQLCYGRIVYDEQEKKELICDFLIGLNNVWLLARTEKDKNNLLLCIKNIIKWLSIFFKHECFAMEEEYRMVVTLPYHELTDYFEQRETKKECLYKTRFTNNMFTPYIKMRFRPEGIKGVCMNPLSEKYTTEFRYRNDIRTVDLIGYKDVLQYGVHEFLRVNGYHLNESQIQRSEIPLRY
ncbi:DUF2971 domain-containing protein [Anaerovorax odorimutans]|uniref:DUF2971 domain-containing protein n=1 Tax=Anaerovorax odorimutans TaxID=109327 RepID=UPI0004058E47|nr:DUF2971 domain-containing protein [Anaerovorax odorimutans]